MTRLDQLASRAPLLLRMILLPTALLLILSYLFSGIYVQPVPFAVVDLDRSSLSRTIVHQLGLHPGLDLKLQPEGTSALEAAIREGKVAGGLVLPEGLRRDLAEKKSPRVLLVVDATNVLVASTTQGYVGTVLATVNAGFQVTLLEGQGALPGAAKSTVTSFSVTERVRYEPTMSYLLYLVYLIFLYTTQTLYFAQFLMPYLMDRKARWLAGEAVRGPGQGVLFLPFVVGGLLCFSTYVALLAAQAVFGVTLRGDPVIHAALVGVFLAGLTGLGVAASSLITRLETFLQAYYIAALALVLSAGVAWPAAMMPPGYAELVQMVWPLFNVALPLKALHLKGWGWDEAAPVLLRGLVFAAVWGGLGAALWFRLVRCHRPRPATEDKNQE